MLGDLITRCLVLLLGYAYPAFECYKSLEKNRVSNEELMFWCQYWIIVAAMTVLERVGDTLMSWLPIYGELKLALFIYLWYPKTKGTGFVYDTVLRPYVLRHEPEMEKKLLEWRSRAWDLAVFYWQNCTELGQSAFFDVLEYFAGQSAKFKKTSSEKTDKYAPSAPPMPGNGSGFFFRRKKDKQPQNLSKKNKKWPSGSSSSPRSSMDRNMAAAPKLDLVQELFDSGTDYMYTEEASMSEAAYKPEKHLNENLSQARIMLRRLRPQSPRH